LGVFELGCDVAPGGKLELYRRPLPRLNEDCGRLVGLTLGEITDPAPGRDPPVATSWRASIEELATDP